MNDAMLEQSVIDMHRFFTEWFSGTVEQTRSEFTRFTRLLDPEFTLVNPDGSVSRCSEVVALMEGSYAKVPELTVETQNFTVISRGNGLVVASYDELQRWPTGTNARRSTVLFVVRPDSAPGFAWRHAHETWLGEPTAPSGASQPAGSFPSEPPHSPQQVSAQLSRYLSTGDVGGALSLYESDSVFSPRPGKVVAGLAQIREALEEFAAFKPTITLNTPKVLEADGIALVSSEWTLSGTQSDGAAVEMAGFGTDVMRRQPDGTWKFLIDNPWGAPGPNPSAT